MYGEVGAWNTSTRCFMQYEQWSRGTDRLARSDKPGGALQSNASGKRGNFETQTSSHGSWRTENAVDQSLSQRKPFSWTTLILQHAKCGQSRQALRIYEEMQRRGVKQSSYTFVAALKACSSLKDLEIARQIHADIIRDGFESDLYVGTMLVDVYAKCRSLDDARTVFEMMPHRDVVSWNAMILAYAQMEEAEVALQLYTRMQQDGLVPNDRTYVSALKACSSLAARKEGCRVDDGTLFRQLCLKQVRAIHADVVKGKFEGDLFVGNMLLDAFAKCGSLVDARHLFESMPQRDVISWNAMIVGLAQMEDADSALHLYTQMQKEGVVPDDRTFVAALKACSASLAASEERDEADVLCVRSRCLDHVRAIHLKLVKSGCESDVFVATMLVDVYAKCRSLEDARSVFEKMPHRDVVSWNAMISGYAQMEMGGEALQLYTQMQREGIVPNERTFVAALRAYSSLVTWEEGNNCDGQHHLQKRWVEEVRAIHLHIISEGCKPDVFVGNMLVNVYAKCGSMVDARNVFDKMPHRNLVSWTAMMLGYTQVGEGEVAVKMYTRMQQEGVSPDSRAFVAGLKACRSLIALEDGKKGDGGSPLKHVGKEQVRVIHSDAARNGLESDVFVGTMLVDVYAKSGNLKLARQVFEKMPHRNVVSWTAMITGYAQMDEGEEALKLYARMEQEGVVPNDRTFVAALKACGSVAALERGKGIHAHIRSNTNGVDMTSCFVASGLIDMYGKCGSMDSAQQVFDALASKNTVTWSALIAGYARAGDSELVFHLFESMKQERIEPDTITFLSVLTVCSHLGLLDKGRKYFAAMTTDFCVFPTIEHYTCMIDLLGRAGLVEEAMAMVKDMPFQADGALWESVMGACQKWGNVQLGREAFSFAVRLDEEHAAPYALMANIYAGAQMWEEAREMEDRGATKQAWNQGGQSWWTDVGGSVHAFVVGDAKHPESLVIYATLQDLFAGLKEVS